MTHSITINKDRNLKAFLLTGAIGPAHDPYGYTEVVLKLPFNKEGRWYQDGLGRTRWYVDDDCGYSRSGQFVEDTGKELRAKLETLKANLCAKRLFGVTFEEAERLLHEASEARDLEYLAPRYI